MFLPMRMTTQIDALIVLHPKPNRNTKRNNPRPVAYSLQLSRVIPFGWWVPSVVNLAFFGFGETLVHWTHSFLYLHNSVGSLVLQDLLCHIIGSHRNFFLFSKHLRLSLVHFAAASVTTKLTAVHMIMTIIPAAIAIAIMRRTVCTVTIASPIVAFFF